MENLADDGISFLGRLPEGVDEERSAAVLLGVAAASGGERYLVIEELRRGETGVVWRAYDPKLKREVETCDRT